MSFRLPTGSVVGTFGKGIEGSLSINFSTSGSSNCDDACQHKNTTCYAQRIEIRPDRTQLKAKLERHEAMPPWKVCGVAIVEIQRLLAKGKTIPWVRISTAGSLPQPAVARGDKLFATQLRSLLKLCQDNGIPVHIPVETYAKRLFYASLIGTLAVVRESAQSKKRFLAAKGAVSTVAGDRSQSMLERIETARDLAKRRYAKSRRKTIVCPAVVAGFKQRLGEPANDKAKCGNCDACSRANTDIVYPLH